MMNPAAESVTQSAAREAAKDDELASEARAILSDWIDLQVTRQGSAWAIGGRYPLNRLQPKKPYAGMREHDAPRDPSLLDWTEADDDGSTGVIGLAWDLRAAAEKDAATASGFLDAVFAPPPAARKAKADAPPPEAAEPEAREAAPEPATSTPPPQAPAPSPPVEPIDAEFANAEAVEQEEPFAPSLAIFGPPADHTETLRSQRIGDVVRISMTKQAAIWAASGTTEAAYQDLVSAVMRDTVNGSYIGPPERFVQFTALQSVANQAAAVMKVEREAVAFLTHADRAAIEAFNPEIGWPGPFCEGAP